MCARVGLPVLGCVCNGKQIPTHTQRGSGRDGSHEIAPSQEILDGG